MSWSFLSLVFLFFVFFSFFLFFLSHVFQEEKKEQGCTGNGEGGGNMRVFIVITFDTGKW